MGNLAENVIELSTLPEASQERLVGLYALVAQDHQDLSGKDFLESAAQDISRYLTEKIFGVKPAAEDARPLPVELQPAADHYYTAWEGIRHGRLRVLDPEYVGRVTSYLS